MSASSKTQIVKPPKKSRKKQKREARRQKAEVKKQAEKQLKTNLAKHREYRFLHIFRVAGITLVLYILFGISFTTVFALSFGGGIDLSSAFFQIALKWPQFLIVFAHSIWSTTGAVISLGAVLLLIFSLVLLAHYTDKRLSAGN